MRPLPLLLLITICCGCYHPLLSEERSDPAPTPFPEEKRQEPSPVEEQVKDDPTGIAVTVNVSPSVWSFVTQHLINNAIHIEKPITVQQDDGLKIEVPTGTVVTLTSSSEESIEVGFSKPYPTATKYRVIKTSIQSVTLRSDGSGIARTGLKDFRFRWTDEEETDTSTADPEVATVPQTRIVVVTATWCGPCNYIRQQYGDELRSSGVEFADYDLIPGWQQFARQLPAVFAVNGDNHIIDNQQGVSISGIKQFIAKHRNLSSTKATTYSGKSHTQWTFPGSTRSDLIEHLLTSPHHRGKFSREELSRYSFEDLREIHSDDHEGVL